MSMRELIDILDKILTESQIVDEEVTLSAGEITKYPERFDAFINHIRSKRPFYISSTGQEVVLNPTEADRIEDLHQQDLFKGPQKVTDINGNVWNTSAFKKTAEFGGASSKPGEENDPSKMSKEGANLKPNKIGITDRNIPAKQLGSVIINNQSLQSTGWGRAVIEMAKQIVAGEPAIIPAEIRKYDKIVKAIIDNAGEYLGVLALVNGQSEWYGGAATQKNFVKWLGSDVSGLVVNFPSKETNALADSFATVTNAATGHTLNISSKGTGGGAAPSLSSMVIPDSVKKNPKNQTAVDIIELTSNKSLPSPTTISQALLMMNLLQERLPKTIPPEYKGLLPFKKELVQEIRQNMRTRTPMPKYQAIIDKVGGKGSDGGKLAYSVKKDVMKIINSGVVPEFEEVVLEVLDYNFIQQYANYAGNKSGMVSFATQWPAKLDGEVSIESKSSGNDPIAGGFSFKLHPKGSPMKIDPDTGEIESSDRELSVVSPSSNDTSDLDAVSQKRSNVRASGLPNPVDNSTLGRRRR